MYTVINGAYKLKGMPQRGSVNKQDLALPFNENKNLT